MWGPRRSGIGASLHDLLAAVEMTGVAHVQCSSTPYNFTGETDRVDVKRQSIRWAQGH